MRCGHLQGSKLLLQGPQQGTSHIGEDLRQGGGHTAVEGQQVLRALRRHKQRPSLHTQHLQDLLFLLLSLVIVSLVSTSPENILEELKDFIAPGRQSTLDKSQQSVKLC